MRITYKFAALVLVAALTGCSVAPILNVDSSPATAAAGKALSPDQVRSAIVRAGAALGWLMKDEGAGKLVGTLQLRTHTAVVEIPYTAATYSIKYRSSTGLGENGTMIHKNYNGWVQNLQRGINAQLAAS